MLLYKSMQKRLPAWRNVTPQKEMGAEEECCDSFCIREQWGQNEAGYLYTWNPGLDMLG